MYHSGGLIVAFREGEPRCPCGLQNDQHSSVSGDDPGDIQLFQRFHAFRNDMYLECRALERFLNARAFWLRYSNLQRPR